MSIGLATIFTYAAPLVIRATIDSIIGDKPLSAPSSIIIVIERLGGTTVIRHNLWMAAILLVSLAIFRGFFGYLSGRWSAHAAESIAKNLRNQLYTHLQTVPAQFHAKSKTGDLIQRCTSDVETVRKFLAIQVVEVGRSTMMLGFIIPILIYLNVQMALLSLIIIPFIITFAVIFFIKVRQVFQIADESEGVMSAVLQENLTGIRVVRAFARQDFEIDKFNKKNTAYRNNIFRLIKLLAVYWGLSDLLIYSQTGLVLFMGTYWAIQGVITLGTMVAFLTYIEFLLWPIRQTGRTLTDLGKASVSLGRIKEILDEPVENTTGWSPENHQLRGEISFENVGFNYGENTPVLKNINLKIKSGETIVFIGPTGSGKSTLVNLLPRLWDYTDGSIKIDGHELKSINRRYIRSQIGIVLQEPFLYSKTLLENIRLGKIKKPPDVEIFEASGHAAIHDEILAFEKGYSTLVGERGVTLSGGQKQRIAIARAILQKPAILIFDDSLSALDTETENRIQNALLDRHGLATTIVIAHRLSSAVNSDLIIVLENGTISQIGTHEKLIKTTGLYQRLWEIQSAVN